jgi:hypothetical protein
VQGAEGGFERDVSSRADISPSFVFHCQRRADRTSYPCMPFDVVDYVLGFLEAEGFVHFLTRFVVH